MARDESAPIIQRSPFAVPTDPRELGSYLDGELNRLWGSLQALAAGHLTITYVEPDKPRPGDIRYADGTEWNPGSGEGIYRRTLSDTWVKVG